MQKRILITGGAGFIGSHIVDSCLKDGHQVYVIDNLSTGKISNIEKDTEKPSEFPPYAYLKFEKADINDLETMMGLFSACKPDVVFHLAAQINVRESIKDPRTDAETNIIGTINVLEAMRHSGCKRIIFSSTGGAMFGDDIQLPPYNEKDRPTPKSPYGVSKLAAEKMIEFYDNQYGIKSTILRYANVYGPRQDPHGESGVVAIFEEKIKKGETPTIYGDGTQTRDFIHVDDVVWANMLTMNEDIYGLFNVGTGIETSINQLWETMSGGKPCNHGPAVPGEVQRSSLDASKLQFRGWEFRKLITPF